MCPHNCFLSVGFSLLHGAHKSGCLYCQLLFLSYCPDKRPSSLVRADEEADGATLTPAAPDVPGAQPTC